MRADARSGGWYHRVVVYLLFLILLLPLAGTLLYSLATSWSASLLPSGLTFKWYIALWSEPRFWLPSASRCWCAWARCCCQWC